jgi:hypothetical protein
MGGPSMAEDDILRIKTRNPEEIVRRINLILSDFLPEIYRYNDMIKDKRYYLKPVHIVIKKRGNGHKIKYYYYGRYWYKIEKNKGRKGIKWVYIGREKPEPSLPDPPRNPLEGLAIKINGNEIAILSGNKYIYKIINDVLSSSRTIAESSPAQ